MFVSRRLAPLGCVALLILATAVPRAAAQNGYANQIVITGVAIPGTGGNAFSSNGAQAFGTPAINNVGQIAFQGSFPGGNGVFAVNGTTFNTIPDPTNNNLPFTSKVPGATYPSVPVLNTIALSGQPPAEYTGLQFTSFNAFVPLNNTTAANVFGEMAYQGALTGAGVSFQG